MEATPPDHDVARRHFGDLTTFSLYAFLIDLAHVKALVSSINSSAPGTLKEFQYKEWMEHTIIQYLGTKWPGGLAGTFVMIETFVSWIVRSALHATERHCLTPLQRVEQEVQSDGEPAQSHDPPAHPFFDPNAVRLRRVVDAYLRENPKMSPDVYPLILENLCHDLTESMKTFHNRATNLGVSAGYLDIPTVHLVYDDQSQVKDLFCGDSVNLRRFLRKMFTRHAEHRARVGLFHVERGHTAPLAIGTVAMSDYDDPDALKFMGVHLSLKCKPKKHCSMKTPRLMSSMDKKGLDKVLDMFRTFAEDNEHAWK